MRSVGNQFQENPRVWHRMSAYIRAGIEAREGHRVARRAPDTPQQAGSCPENPPPGLHQALEHLHKDGAVGTARCKKYVATNLGRNWL